MLLEFLVPAYNRESVERTIDSILLQILELVDPSMVGVSLVDDAGENFNVMELQRNDWKRVENLRVRRNPSNLGMSRNLLTMVRSSEAEFVFVLTDDDYLEEEALRHCLSVLQSDSLHSGYLTPRIGWDDDGKICVVQGQLSSRKRRIVGTSRSASVRYANQGHILSGLILRRSAINLAHWEKFVDNAYFPIAIITDILRGNTMLYEPKSLVHHTVYNETHWHRWGDTKLEVAARLYIDYAEVIINAGRSQGEGLWSRSIISALILRNLIWNDVSWIVHYGNSERPLISLETSGPQIIYAFSRWCLGRFWRVVAGLHKRRLGLQSKRLQCARDRLVESRNFAA